MYHYKCRCLSITDGDTVELDIDLGRHVHIIEKCRLYGINAFPKSSEQGKLATARLKELIEAAGSNLMCKTFLDKEEKYGRLLVDLLDSDEFSLNQVLLVEGLVVPYFGTGPRAKG